MFFIFYFMPEISFHGLSSCTDYSILQYSTVAYFNFEKKKSSCACLLTVNLYVLIYYTVS